MIALFTTATINVTFTYTQIIHTDNQCNNLLYENNAPTSALADVLALTHIAHDNTLESIITMTQVTQDRGGWLRSTGKERWEIDEVFADKRDVLLPLFDRLGVLKEVTPSQHYYDYAILLGASVFRVRTRLWHLIALWNSGIRFGSIIILSGQRQLDPQRESYDILFNEQNGILLFKPNWQYDGKEPRTEIDMMKLVFDQSQVPAEWKSLPIIFIDTPMQQTAYGSWRRPNTQDTIETWLGNNPLHGSILLISNQPFIGYQNAVLQKFIPDNFVIETVGEAASPNIKISIVLDTLARWLYQNYQGY